MKPTSEEMGCLIHNTTFSRLLCLNDVKARLYLPVTIFLAILIVIGTIGNTAVCLVYLRRKTRASSHYFILALAALDLMTCVIGLPTEIADLLLPYTFESPWACKVLRFTHSSTIIASSTILIQVAFDRYYRICQLGRQFTANKAKFLCVGAVILGFICSWPTFILFGRKTVVRRLGTNIVKGTDCSTDDSMRRTIYPTVYYVFLFSLFGATVIFFSVLYSKIGLTILRRKNFTSGSINSPPPTPRGLKRAGSRKQNAPDPPSMDISSGHDDGHGDSTASSGSSASGGSNFSTSTSSTTVPTFLYGNLRRFCSQKKDAEGSKIWPPQIFGPAANRLSANDNTSTHNQPRGDEVTNSVSNLRVPRENTNRNNSFTNSISYLNDDNQERNSDVYYTNNGDQEGRNEGNNFNKTSSLNRHTVTESIDSIADLNRTSSVFTFDNIGSISPLSRKSKTTCVQIKATHKTRVYVSTNAQGRSTLPSFSLPTDVQGRTTMSSFTLPTDVQGRTTQSSFNLPTERPHLQHNIQESEDEEKQEDSRQSTHQNPEQTSKRPSQRQIRVGKTTTVLFAVTLAYILSFLPYLTVMVMRSIIKDLEENLSPVGELAYKLCVKSFFINNAINPLIYSFLNQAFRQDAKQMLSRMCGRSRSSGRGGRALHHGDAV